MLGNEVAGGASGSPTGEAEESWATNPRKRKKKGKESEVLKGVKLRRTSSTTESQRRPSSSSNPTDIAPKNSTADSSEAKVLEVSEVIDETSKSKAEPFEKNDTAPAATVEPSPMTKPAGSLGLVAYGSDSDSD
jgi:hypothetical protein